MTIAQKNNLKTIIPYLSYLPMLYLIYSWGQYTGKNESRMFDSAEQKEHVKHHVQDSEVHMPYSEKVKVFVPRTEIETITEDICEIKIDIKTLLLRDN